MFNEVRLVNCLMPSLVINLLKLRLNEVRLVNCLMPSLMTHL